jgi:phosphoribosylaminoimidazole-succinocarboxamide synthase
MAARLRDVSLAVYGACAEHARARGIILADTKFEFGTDEEGVLTLGDDLLMVASDRISTYDVVHPTPIPDKGKVLTGLSVLWFGLTRDIVANHLISATEGVPAELRGRALRVRRLEMLPVECVVRGYLSGSGWKDYQASGTVSGVSLPPGLRESERLPEPIFTPSTKALEGHDEAIDFERACELVGDDALMERVRDRSIELYSFAAEHARERGVILADTKFEFGLDERGELVLGDEALTPDSSRYWPAAGYEPGRGQPSNDKQFVRDWASASGWDKRPPAPAIPDEVVAGTRARYVEAYELITGEPFEEWLTRTDAVHAQGAA